MTDRIIPHARGLVKPLIPFTIHQLWIGPPMPEGMDADMERWQELHPPPKWEYHLWTEEEIRSFGLQNAALYEVAEEITPQAPYQLRADIARYEILHRHGGVWVDTDFTPQKPIDELIENSPGWLAWEVEGRWLNNAIMAFPDHHPLLHRLIHMLPRNVQKFGPQVGNNRKTGPKFITPIARSFSRSVVEFLPQRFFYPYAWNEIETGHYGTYPDAYAIHHWNHQRTLKEYPY